MSRETYSIDLRKEDWTLIRGDQDLIKRMNRTQVLDVIRREGPVSKVEISARTRLTFATVSNIVRSLSDSGIISPGGEGESSGGRRPVLYELKPDARCIVAVDISVEEWTVAVMDLSTDILIEHRQQTPSSGGPDAYIDAIVNQVEALFSEARVEREKVVGIGVSTPGPVHAATGEVHHPPNLPGWGRVPLKAKLEQALGFPVKVEKDANAAALGERWFGAGKDVDELLYVLVGEGIGGGMVIGGSLYHGHRFGAGEIGHGTVDLDGPQCNCGNYGCLEAMASGIAIVKEIETEMRRGAHSPFYPGAVTFPAVLKALQKGDPLTRSVTGKASRILGIGLTGALNALHPGKVIIGGKVPLAYPGMVEEAARVAKSRVVSEFRDRLDIVQGELGERSTLIGAASLVLEGVFTIDLK